MKNVIRTLAVALILCAMVSVASASMQSAYTVSSAYLVDAVGWWFNEDVTLVLNDDGTTYSLIYKEDVFGTTDPGIKGNKTVIYSGTYTAAPASDGVAAHLDITLDTVDRIYLEQHNKAYGRQEIINYPAVIDTANWNDYMEEVSLLSADEFLAEYAANAQGITITVEDILLDVDDIELSTKIVSLPFEMPWSAEDAGVPLAIAR